MAHITSDSKMRLHNLLLQIMPTSTFNTASLMEMLEVKQYLIRGNTTGKCLRKYTAGSGEEMNSCNIIGWVLGKRAVKQNGTGSDSCPLVSSDVGDVVH
jgi:hypothetical protein